MNFKKIIFKYLRPIDLIGLTGLTTVIFLYFYYSAPFNDQDLLYLLIIVLGLLVLIFGTLFFEAVVLFEASKRFKDYFNYTFKRTKDFAFKIIPFFIFISLYNQIHDLTRLINDCNFDSILIKIDHFLLAGKDIVVLSQALISDHLSNWLVLAYNSHFLLFIITPLILFLLKKYYLLDDLLLTIVMTIYLGLLGYILVPCVGPVLAQRDLLTIPLWEQANAFKEFYRDIITGYASYKDMFHCFPSLHIAVSFVWLVYIWRSNRIIFLFYLPLILSMWLATIYLRWHYLIDNLAGLLIAFLALWLAPKVNKWWQQKKLLYK